MSRSPRNEPIRARAIWRWLLGLFYLTAGVVHLTWPQPFLAIIPPRVPAKETIVALTGLAEILGALGLLQSRWNASRKIAAVGLALYALCVWPANINHMLMDLDRAEGGLSLAYHVPRLALQPVIIWLALWTGGVTDWPFRRSASRP